MMSMEKSFVIFVLCVLSVATTLVTLIKSLVASHCDMIPATGKIKGTTKYRSRMIVKYEYKVDDRIYNGSFTCPSGAFNYSAEKIGVEYRSDKPSVSFVPEYHNIRQETRNFAKCAFALAVSILFMFFCSPWKFLLPIMRNIDKCVSVELSEGRKGREIMFDIAEVKAKEPKDDLSFSYSIPLRTLFSLDFGRAKLYVLDGDSGKAYVFNPVPVRFLCGISKTEKNPNHLFGRMCNSEDKQKFADMIVEDNTLWFVSLPNYEDSHVQIWHDESIVELCNVLYGIEDFDMNDFALKVINADDGKNYMFFSLEELLEQDFGENSHSRSGIILNRGTEDAVFFPNYEVKSLVREIKDTSDQESEIIDKTDETEEKEKTEEVDENAFWWK